MIDADDSRPFRIVEPSPPMKNGRRRVKVVREFRTEPEASKELTRLAKAGDSAATHRRGEQDA